MRRPLATLPVLAGLCLALGCGPRPAELEAWRPSRIEPPPDLLRPPAPLPVLLGQTPALSLPEGAVDLDTCIEIALARNRDQARQRIGQEQSRLARLAAFRQIYQPSLRLNYQISDDGRDDGFGRAEATLQLAGFDITPYLQVAGNGLYDDDDNQFGGAAYRSEVGVVISRQLLRFSEHLRQRLPLTRANQNLYLAAYERIRAARNLIFTVTRSYHDLLRAERRLEIRRRRLQDAERFLAEVEKLVPKTAAPIEATTARIDAGEARVRLLAEETRVTNQREAFLDLLDLPPDTPLTLAEVDITLPPDDALEVQADLARLLARHESVLSQELRLEVLRQEMTINADRLMPDLEASLRLAHRRDGEEPFGKENEEDDLVVFGLSMSVPLDAYLAERAVYGITRLDLRQAEMRLQEIRQELTLEQRQQLRRIAELRRLVELATVLQAAEQEKLTSSLQRYRDGSLDNLEVTRAKVAAEDAEVALLDARTDLILALAAYQNLIPPPAAEAELAPPAAAGLEQP